MEHFVGHLAAELPQKALIAQNGKVLVVRHIDEDFWQLPGGRVHEEENSKDALIREIYEELSVRVEPHRILDTFVLKTRSGKIYYVTVYACKLLDEISQIKKEEEEIAEILWVNKEEIKTLIFGTGYKEIIEKFFQSTS